MNRWPVISATAINKVFLLGEGVLRSAVLLIYCWERPMTTLVSWYRLGTTNTYNLFLVHINTVIFLLQ